MTTNKIRLIAVDMDGTLLNSQGKVSKGNLEAIQRAQAEGIVFSVCTGRFFENASILVRDLGLECPLITLNGGKIADGPFGTVLSTRKMPPQQARAVFELLEAADASYFIFSDGYVAIRRPNVFHHSQVDFGSRMQSEAKVEYAHGKDACEKAMELGMYKFYVDDAFSALPLITMEKQMAAIPNIEVTRSSPHNIEVMPIGVDKEQGVRELTEYLNIPMEQVMCIGDQENDLPMIRVAGLGVAMGNATPQVKLAADVITETNDNDGVAAAILSYALSSANGQA